MHLGPFSNNIMFQKGESYVTDALQRIETSTDAQAAAQHADLIIEAIVENMDVKKNLFRSLDKVAPKYADLRPLLSATVSIMKHRLSQCKDV